MATSQRRVPRQGHRPRRRGRPEPRILLDPDLWGLAGGTLGGTLVLVVHVLLNGIQAFHWQVLIGAGITFVVSYVGTALFVWYLRTLREHGLAAMAEARRHAAEAHDDSAAAGTAGAEKGP